MGDGGGGGGWVGGWGNLMVAYDSPTAMGRNFGDGAANALPKGTPKGMGDPKMSAVFNCILE